MFGPLDFNVSFAPEFWNLFSEVREKRLLLSVKTLSITISVY